MISGAEIFSTCIDSFEVITLKNRNSTRIILLAICMMMLILDSRTSISGASEGMDVCLKALIPSLFPFIILSILLTDALLGKSIPFLHSVARLCRIPRGGESLLAIGFLAGYPVGAQNIVMAWERGVLSEKDAQRMVVFCNNAGPAFIFGFLGQAFQNPLCPWLLWIIHILSALAVGLLIPADNTESYAKLNTSNITVPEALTKSIHVMAQICGWVVLFRITLKFLQRWILCFLPAAGQVLITGFLELANGCLLLHDLPSDGLKFVLCSLMLGFGGICVYLQTRSVSGILSLHLYLPGKILHGCISFLISYGVQYAFVPEMRCVIAPGFVIVILILAVFTGIYLLNIEKSVAFSNRILYNEKSCEKRRILCCSGKKSKNPASTVPMAPN